MVREMRIDDGFKFTLALNKSVSEDQLLFASLIAALKLEEMVPPERKEKMGFLTFRDADDEDHKQISGLSLIVMRGKNSELRKFFDAATERGLDCVSFTKADALESCGQPSSNDDTAALASVMAFGRKADVEASTGRLSLWK